MKRLPNVNMADPLHADFARTIEVYEQILSAQHNRPIFAARVRQMLAKGKTVEAILEKWATQHTSSGLELLLEHGMPDLTGEALVMKYPDRFSALAKLSKALLVKSNA